MLRHDPHSASNALFGAAAMFLGPAATDWVFAGFQPELYDWIVVGGCAFLVAMAAWARRQPLLPSAISLIVVVGWFAYLSSRGVLPRPIDWILEATCLLLIGFALLSSILSRRRTAIRE